VAASTPSPGDGYHRADPRRLGTTCVARIAELFPDTSVFVGIGAACRDSREIARSYAEAHRTTETLRRLGRGGTVTAFEDLGIHRLLLQVPDLSELRSFARDVLGPLSQHERQHKSEYLATLACYFRENNSPQRASRVLHVHPNTVAYRVRRIEEITGLDLDNYRDRLTTQVALEILDALGDEP
jgi:DNA-binding PucR family transcriptional regulator